MTKKKHKKPIHDMRDMEYILEEYQAEQKEAEENTSRRAHVDRDLLTLSHTEAQLKKFQHGTWLIGELLKELRGEHENSKLGY